MSTLARWRAGRIEELIGSSREFYDRGWTKESACAWQLECLNEQWDRARRHVPYFRRLYQNGTVPDLFSCWEEFRSSLPIVGRRLAQDHRAQMIDESRSPDAWRSTGGSTGQPLQFPVWDSEIVTASRNVWFGRSWFGVVPSDRLFIIWGHSHLLGSGWRGRANAWKRRIADRLLGYCRWSAYDLSEKAMQRAAAALVRFRPQYFVGYSVALDRFAQVNRDRSSDLQQLQLKVTIATAESFPKPASASLVSRVLGSPVAMEYGTIETGPLAYEKPAGGFFGFWRDYYLEGVESDEIPGMFELLVTSLYPRAFPLWRYRTGDLISSDPTVEESYQGFGRVVGSCHETLVMRDGAVVHSQGLTDALKETPSMEGYQFQQDSAERIVLCYVAPEPLGPGELSEMRRRLAIVHPDLRRAHIQRVPHLEKTVAGKTRLVLRKSA